MVLRAKLQRRPRRLSSLLQIDFNIGYQAEYSVSHTVLSLMQCLCILYRNTRMNPVDYTFYSTRGAVSEIHADV
jgi:hypothetical protein